MKARTLHVCTLALVVSLSMGCPSAQPCPDGQLYYPDEGRCRVPDTDAPMPMDTGTDVAMGDASCGGACTAPQVCDFATGDCVDCVEDEDCSSTSRGEACISNVCEACRDDDQCTEVDASACNASNECEGCAADADCTHLTATPVCDEPSSTCVPCTADDVSACPSGVCLLSTNTCAPMGGSTPLCGACTADSGCAAGQVCAPTEFPVGSGTVVGTFCLWRLDASTGPAGDCLDAPPYRREDSVTTTDGTTVDVCTPGISTCDALLDFLGPTCTNRGAADPACGMDGIDDGFCPATGSAVCTVACSSFRDCPCVDETCARQYECASNRCNSARSCDTTTGTCG